MKQNKILILKSNGATENFAEEKVFNSVKYSCQAVKSPDKEAELFAKEVTKQVINWIGDKTEVTSFDLRLHTYQFLSVFNPEAAFFYRTYKQII